MSENKSPEIIVQPTECPYCKGKTGINFNIRGPQTVDQKQYYGCYGKIVCFTCKREWQISMLTKIKENN